jgi:hypothetical protein
MDGTLFEVCIYKLVLRHKYKEAGLDGCNYHSRQPPLDTAPVSLEELYLFTGALSLLPPGQLFKLRLTSLVTPSVKFSHATGQSCPLCRTRVPSH